MRWLVLYPRLAPAELGVLREHFGAAGHPPAALRRWLEGPLADALAMALTAAPAADAPLSLVVHRGRLTLRQPLDIPSLPLHGLRLIEASAGTGKTYTIALLYLRLVIGHRLPRAMMPPDILVLTFTEAAAGELARGVVRPAAVEPHVELPDVP